LSLIPFLSIYLNKLKETGGQSLYEAMYYTPKLFNLFNMGVDNLVYGKLAEIITPKGYDNKYYSGEFIIGFSPLMILALVLVSFYLWRNKNKDISFTAYKSLIISIVISCVIMVNIDGKSLWEIVWNYIPGAKGIRVSSRFAIFLVFPVCIIITYLLSKISATKYKHLGLLFSALFILEQVNNAEIHNLDRKEHLSFLNAVGSPPLECRAFFVTKQRTDEFLQQNKADIYPHNVDAMLVSEAYNIRTINGFTTFNPPGWDFKLYPLDTYASRVNNYIKNNNIEDGMCELDLFDRKWIVHKFATPPMLIPVDVSNIKLSVNYDGKHKLTIANDTNIKIGKGTNYPLNIGVRATDENGKVMNYDVKRITLPVIDPKSSITLDIDLENQMAEYKSLDITLVQEGVAWLDDFGLIPVKP
ncbi:TPA: hypothetical protein U5E24_001560, partial [Yersinia enterocolitica]|nr:hypothetical protein [Yersinia enterocolitica]